MIIASRSFIMSLATLAMATLCIVSEAFVPSSSMSNRATLSTSYSFLPFQPLSSSTTSLMASSSVSSESKRKNKSTTTVTAASTTNKKKKKGKGPPNPSLARKLGPGRSLSEEELTEHVAARYINDKRGKLRQAIMESEEDLVDNDMEEQAQFLKELNRSPALVLNADFHPLSYLPLSLWTWQDAVKAIFSGKVQVVDVYPDVCVRAANFEVPLPSVIALLEYVPQKHQRPAFTRRNVFLRDEYKCQYCNDRFHTADLSLDHVIPRCKGGQLTWENAVTSCLKCNGRKGSMPVTELRAIGMRLIREPKCPTQMELAAKAARMVPRRVHPTWKPYLGIDVATHHHGTGNSERTGDEDFIDDRYFAEVEEY